MIDPNIALATRNPQFDNPLDDAQKAMSLKSMANQQQLQQAQLTGANQANQAQGIQLAQQQALNKAIAQNTQVGPDGKPFIDHDAVVKQLTAAGQGTSAMQYMGNLTAMKEAQLKMGQLQDQVNYDRAQHAGSWAQSILSIQDPTAQAAAYQMGKAQAVSLGYVQPGQLPDQYNDQTKAMLQQIGQAAMSVKDQYGTKYGQERVDALTAESEASKARARAAEEKADAYAAKAGQDNWKPNGVTSDGHNIYFNPATRETWVDRSAKVALSDSGSGGGQGGVTPNAQGVQKRANDKAYKDASQSELDNRQVRDSIDSATQSGTLYVDQNGKSTPFSSMKRVNPDGTPSTQPLTTADIAGLKAEMQRRRAVAQSAVEQAVADKNNAIAANGGTPQVSTQQAIAAYRGQAAPQTGGGGQVFAVDPTGKSQFKVGQTLYNKQGQPVKVGGFTQDGKVIPGK